LDSHVIRFGGAPATLVKSPQRFTLFRPDAATVAALAGDPQVSALYNPAPGLWRVTLASAEATEGYMAKMRERLVAHHEYHFERPGFRSRFIATERVNVRLRESAPPGAIERLVESLALARLHDPSAPYARLRVTSRTGMNPVKLCEKLAGSTPLDLRCLISEIIITPNTTMPIPTHHQNTIMCRP